MPSAAGKMKIGVLALQGSVHEHLQVLSMLQGVEAMAVKYPQQFAELAGLIIPGGESTTLNLLLNQFGLLQPILDAYAGGMGIWGTCAGLILMAKKVVGGPVTLGLMDICAVRNAYGRQLESFATEQVIPTISPVPLKLTFIRAPIVTEPGPDVEVLMQLDGKIVAARQGRLLATSFHPELTGESAVYKYFIDTCLAK